MFLQIATTVILARMLPPDEFGIFAMVIPVIALTSLIQDLGLQQAVIQRQDISREQISQLYWINFAMTILIAIFLIVAAPFIASFYGEGRLTALTCAWALILVLGGIGFQHYALLAREFRFKALALIDIACAVFSFVTALVAAYFLHSFWALWLAGVASVTCWIVLAMATTGWRPSLPKRGVDLDGMVGFGMNITFHNFANYASRNLDNILIGHHFGAVVLGYYDRAYKLLLYPHENLAGPLSRVMVPVLSRVQDQPAQFRRVFLQSCGVLNLVSIPGMVVAIWCSDELVTLLLGEKWLPISPIFFWLGIAGIMQPLINAAGWLFLAQGRSRELMLFSIAGSIVTAIGFFVGLRWGAVGVACAYSIVEYVFRIPLLFYLGGRKGSVSALDLITGVAPLLLAAGLTVLSIFWLRQTFTLGGPALIFVSLVLAYLEALLCMALVPSGRHVLSSGFQILGEFFQKATVAVSGSK